MRPPKYDYDIKKIETLINTGISMRAVARALGYPPDTLNQWLGRNYTVEKQISIKFAPKKSPKSLKKEIEESLG